MTTLVLTQTDTAAGCGTVQLCSAHGLSSTPRAREAGVGASAGSSALSASINRVAVGDKSGVMFQSASGEPGLAYWNPGTWTIRLNVTTANALLTWTKVYVCRVNVACGSVTTIGSNTTVGTSVGTTGVKSTTVTGSAHTGTDTDMVYVVLVFLNSASGTESFSFTPDQNIDTPLEVFEIAPASVASSPDAPTPVVMSDVLPAPMTTSPNVAAPTIEVDATLDPVAMAAAVPEPSVTDVAAVTEITPDPVAMAPAAPVISAEIDATPSPVSMSPSLVTTTVTVINRPLPSRTGAAAARNYGTGFSVTGAAADFSVHPDLARIYSVHATGGGTADVNLPDASLLPHLLNGLAWFHIVNESTTTYTIKDFDGNSVATMAANKSATVDLLSKTGTGEWYARIQDH